jgi:hypothetical protein
MPVSVGFLHAQARGIVFVGAVCKVQKDQHYCMARTQTKPHKHRRRDFMFFLQLFDQVFSAANAKKSDSMRNSTLGRDEPSRSPLSRQASSDSNHAGNPGRNIGCIFFDRPALAPDILNRLESATFLTTFLCGSHRPSRKSPARPGEERKHRMYLNFRIPTSTIDLFERHRSTVRPQGTFRAASRHLDRLSSYIDPDRNYPGCGPGTAVVVSTIANPQ